MSLPMKAGRALATLVLWIVVVLGLFQEGARLSLRAALRSELASEAPVRVRLLLLRAYSPRGEGLFRGVRVGWRGVRVSLLQGVRADSIELGPALAPVMRARGVDLTGLWPTLRGRVGSLSISPVRPEWRKLMGPPSPGTNWLVRLPLSLDVPHLTIGTPLGSLQGPASVWGERRGRQGTWSATLFNKEGRRVEASGRWDRSGGRCWARMAGGAWGDWEGQISFGPETFRVTADAWTREGSWSLDGSGRRGGNVRVVLWRRGTAGSRTMCLLTALFPEAAGWAGVQLEDLHGSVEVPPIPIGASSVFRGGVLTLESPETAESRCVSAGLVGRVETPAGGFDARCKLQVISQPRTGTEIVLGGALAPSQEPAAGPGAAGVDWFLQSFRSADGATRIQGRARSPGSFDLDLAAGSGPKGWSGEAHLRGAAGKLDCRGDSGEGGWMLSGKGQLEEWRNQRPGLPLPTGPLKVQFGVAGTGFSVKSGEVKASGGGSWTGSWGAGRWRVQVRDGSLASRDLRLTGIEASAGGEIGPESTWRGRVRTREGEVDGNALGSASIEATGKGLQADCRADVGLPFLGGRAEGTFALNATEGEVRLEQGALSLLGQNVVFSGVRATLARPYDTLRPWSCQRLTVFGEVLQQVQGTLAFRDGVASLAASAAHWGGTVRARLDLSPRQRPVLGLEAAAVDATPLPAFLGHWIKLPVGTEHGLLDGTVRIPLDNPVEGLQVAMRLRGVTLEVGDANHLFRKASGLLQGELAGGVFRVPEGPWTVEDGAVPLRFGLTASDAGTTVRFATGSLPLRQIQNAAFDFLPEFFSFGQVEGRASISGELATGAEAQSLSAELGFEDASFTSEDRSLRLRGVTGTLPLVIRFGEARQAVPGYPAVEMKGFEGAFEGLGNRSQAEAPLQVARARFSVFTMDGLKLFPRIEGGNLVLRLAKSALWRGKGRGEVALALSTEGIRYVGTFLLAGASLATFCDQSGALKGFIGGDLYGGATFSGERVGLDALRAVVNLWVDPHGEEEKVISRDFLVKMGGDRIKSILHADELEYDQAVLRCGLVDGALTFYDLVLNHKAQPVKAVLRKDVSFEVRLPERNSVPLRQLLERIKGLEGGTGGAAQPSPPADKPGEGP